MQMKKNFSAILKNDRRIRFLLGGMVLDGLLVISLLALAGVMAAL